MTAAIAVGLLVTAGVYLILQRGLVRVIVGFVLLGHAVNVLLVASGGMRLRQAPLLDGSDPARMADPLPQAFVLTAIVITFGITVYLFAIARAGGDDDPAGDVQDPDAPAPSDRGGDPDRGVDDRAGGPGARPDEAAGSGGGPDPGAWP